MGTLLWSLEFGFQLGNLGLKGLVLCPQPLNQGIFSPLRKPVERGRLGHHGSTIEPWPLPCQQKPLEIWGLSNYDDFKLIYDYDPSDRPEIPETVALSGIEFDNYADRLYMLTSFEASETDEGLGGYLWTLPISDLDAKEAPTLVLKADKHPLLFAHKSEGIAVLSRDHVFVVHDDDRVVGRETVENPETQFSRQRHQGAYTVLEFNR